MLHSMTAFARLNQDSPWGALVWEIRCVNHRFLDIHFRLPDALRLLEPLIRTHLQQHFDRGRFDVQLSLQRNQSQQLLLQVNEHLVQQVMQAAERINHITGHLTSRLNTIDLLLWPGILETPSPEMAQLQDHLTATLADLSAQLLQQRQDEGEKISQLLNQRCDDIEQQTQQIKAILPSILQQQQQKLQEKLAHLDADIEPQRLGQEVVLLAQKMDVSEELDRLAVHLSAVQQILTEPSPQAVGRRLDFLMQELNREANTLGAKSVDSRCSQIAVQLKVLIEQMREQIQNIE